jgi:regulator of sirC expression with transglutaminase-like and TPR domain
MLMSSSLRGAFVKVASGPDQGLAAAALCFAQIEYPDLDPQPYLDQLDEMGRAAREMVAAAERERAGRASRLAAVTHYLYDELGYEGDRQRYDDARNSLLNVVLDRRAGIPISLAVVLMEVSARAGVYLEGVNFPGHFLVRAPAAADEPGAHDLLIDPFHRGAIVSEVDCSRLLRGHLGEDATLSPGMFATASRQQILVRMLLNLKRAYVRMRSFGHARHATELLLALDPSALTELRDRGLLAYHVEDYSSAIRDLQSYLRLVPAPADEDDRREQQQVWEHVKTLKRRLASLN